ncbi:MAG: protein translocase subunit SecF [Cyanobacteriota bacterium]|nr:protein translocase subunit SecF [Cyanobacteriota bacterium]
MTASPAPVPPQIRFFRINRQRQLAWWGSALAVVLSVLGMALCWQNPGIGAPLKPGLDFTGGTQILVQRQCDSGSCTPISVAAVQKSLGTLQLPEGDNGASPPRLDGAVVQVLDQGKSLLLRLPALEPAQGAAVVSDLESLAGPLVPAATGVDTIGPTLGAQLLQNSVVSLLVSFVAIAIYIALRYDRVYAFLALLCLAHDVLITCGVFAWLGLLHGVEVDSLFAVALITVAGYSVTDTVVVFDRIREQKTVLSGLSMTDQVDVAVDATLTRSLYTSFTTLLPLLGLIFFGGASLYWFSVALAIGITVGSWSSIGLAPTLLPVFSRR